MSLSRRVTSHATVPVDIMDTDADVSGGPPNIKTYHAQCNAMGTRVAHRTDSMASHSRLYWFGVWIRPSG
eukprot:3450682-Karenia_brevis.AAC.1